MLWATSISDDTDLKSAVGQTATELLSQLQGQSPDLVVAFLSGARQSDAETLPQQVAAHLGAPVLIGCSAGGVIGARQEIEQGPGLTLTGAVLPNVSLEPFHMDANTASEVTRETAWNETLGVSAADAPVFIIVADPFSTDVEPILESLDRCYPGRPKIGGLASGSSQPGQASLFLRQTTHDAGLAGLVMRGDISMETVVAQGCRPIGEPMFVTRAEGNLVFEIDGKTPSAVLRATMESSDPADRRLARRSLFLGLAMHGDRERYGQGDYLIRNIMGLDSKSGALAVAAHPQTNTIVQFHLRDADASDADLKAMLSSYAGREKRTPPVGGLLFSCLGRGQSLYDEPDHDSRVFRETVGDVPLGGFFCNGEIGPVQGRTFLHGYTSAFGLFSPSTRVPDTGSLESPIPDTVPKNPDGC
jgi:small ligand-binding sensory domain FIST